MSRRRVVFGCLGILILAICLAAGLWWRLFSKEAIFVFLNRNQAFQVTQAFSFALMENRVETMRSVVDPDEWHQIEAWVDGHDAVTSCATPPWDLEHPPWFAVGSTSADGKTRDETLQLSLPCPEGVKYYCLKIEDIVLERTDEGWLIKEWGPIRELWQPYPCN